MSTITDDGDTAFPSHEHHANFTPILGQSSAIAKVYGNIAAPGTSNIHILFKQFLYSSSL